MEPVRVEHADYLRMGQWAVITFYVVMILYAVMRRSKPVRRFARRLFMRLQRQTQRNAGRGIVTAGLLFFTGIALIGFFFAGIFFSLIDTLGSSLPSFFTMTGYWMGFLLSHGSDICWGDVAHHFCMEWPFPTQTGSFTKDRPMLI